MSLIEWMHIFNSNKHAKLSIQNKLYAVADCECIDRGLEKTIYAIKNQGLYFVLPTYFQNESILEKFRLEKKILDVLTHFEIKAQQYDLVPIKIEAEGKSPYVLTTLVSQDLMVLNETVSWELPADVTSHPLDFKALLEHFQEGEFVRVFCQKIINEFALACTFSLPIISPNYHAQFYFDNVADKAIPHIRFLVSEVPTEDTDFPFQPIVPHLDAFRSGKEHQTTDYQELLKNLAHQITKAVVFVFNKYTKKELDKKRSALLESQILTAIANPKYLEEALQHAKAKTVAFLEKKYSSLPTLDETSYVGWLMMAISSSHLPLVKKYYKLRPAHTLSPSAISKILLFAKEYQNPSVLIFLAKILENDRLVYLRSLLLLKIETKRSKKKSFGAHLLSYINGILDKQSIETVIQQAKGTSDKAEKCKTALQDLGWFDVTGDLDAVLAPQQVPNLAAPS